MNRKSITLVAVLVAVIVGALGYMWITQGNRQKASLEQDKNSTSQSVAPQNGESLAKGEYVPYTPEALQAATGTKLLFFHASWCPQCRAIEKSIQTGGVPDGVTVFKVDYDSHQELRQKYGVTLQTTFVKVDASGNKTASYVAYEEPDFAAVKRELLP